MNRDVARILNYLFEALIIIFLILWIFILYDIVSSAPQPYYPTVEDMQLLFTDFSFFSLIICMSMSYIFSKLAKESEKTAVQAKSNNKDISEPIQATNNVYCIKCGFENIPDAQFCKQCGTKIE